MSPFQCSRCGVFVKGGNLNRDTHTGRTACKDKGRDWCDAFPRQGMPKIASKPLKLGEMSETDSFSQPSERANTVDTLVSDFQPPEP